VSQSEQGGGECLKLLNGPFLVRAQRMAISGASHQWEAKQAWTEATASDDKVRGWGMH
jgi:hypothetical protein